MNEITKKITSEISDNDVVLYMKGTSSIPQCGFSSQVVHILMDLKINFYDVDVTSEGGKFIRRYNKIDKTLEYLDKFAFAPTT